MDDMREEPVDAELTAVALLETIMRWDPEDPERSQDEVDILAGGDWSPDFYTVVLSHVLTAFGLLGDEHPDDARRIITRLREAALADAG